MKILVCVSKTPETTAKISFKDEITFDEDGVKYILNPYDEWYALVRGIELVEQHGGSVTILNVGSAANDPIIRKGLAIGADEAIRIDAEPRDSLFIATQIAEVAKNDSFDVLLFGKETIDHNNSEVPAMVAQLLDLPFIAFANKMEVADGLATVSRDIEGGVETAEVQLPIVVSAAKGMAEQRIPNMRSIMMAKRKSLKVLPAIDAQTLVSVHHFELPPKKSDCKFIEPERVEELVDLLHNEAKVI